MNNAIPFRAVMDVLVRLESEAAGGAPVCVAIVNRTGKLAANRRDGGQKGKPSLLFQFILMTVSP